MTQVKLSERSLVPNDPTTLKLLVDILAKMYRHQHPQTFLPNAKPGEAKKPDPPSKLFS